MAKQCARKSRLAPPGRALGGLPSRTRALRAVWQCSSARAGAHRDQPSSGNGVYRQTAGGTTLVNGLLAARLQLAAGTRLGGTGQVVGNVEGGQVAPGDNGVGLLAIDGQLGGASFEVELASAASFDRLQVSGAVQAGAARIVFLTGFTPRAGEHHGWLQAGAVSGPAGAGALDLGDTQRLSFATMVDNGISDPFAVDLAEAGAPVVVNGTAYHLLDVGGVRLYAAAEVTPQGLGLQFLDALPAPVPERPAWALLALGGLLGAVARSAAAVGGPRPQPDRCAPRSHGAPCGRRIRSAS